MFKGRKVLVATMHRKEQVIAPILEKELGVVCFVDNSYNTDRWGTFTGEIERALDPLTTVREKCLRAMQLNGCDLGVASEGSFGPHPSYFFVNADDEWLIFIDRLNKVEIVVRELSTDTNFSGRAVTSEEELYDFAGSVGFPTHGLILRQSQDEKAAIYKGITEAETLRSIFLQMKTQNASVYVETDMRALYNPTRMKVIERAAAKLVEKIKSTCPQCHMPGFCVTDVTTGLPCAGCGAPTRSIRSHILVCQHCAFTREDFYPQQNTTEDPRYCDYCNP